MLGMLLRFDFINRYQFDPMFSCVVKYIGQNTDQKYRRAFALLEERLHMIEEGDSSASLTPQGQLFADVMDLMVGYRESQIKLVESSLIGYDERPLSLTRDQRAWNRAHSAFPKASKVTFNKLRKHVADSSARAKKEHVTAQAKKDELLLRNELRKYGVEYLHFLEDAGTPEADGHDLLNSVLVVLVSDFEVLVGEIAKKFYQHYAIAPNEEDIESFSNTSASDVETKYSLKEVLAYTSLEEFKEIAIDNLLEKAMYGSFPEYLKLFQAFNPNFRSENKRVLALPSVFYTYETLEVFQRRHVIVHNGARVSTQYKQKLMAVQDATHVIPPRNTLLQVTPEYVQAANARLILLAFYLTKLLFLGFFKKDAAAEETFFFIMERTTFYALKQGFNYIAFDLGQDEELFYQAGSDNPNLSAKVNYYIAAQRLEVPGINSKIEDWATPPDPLFEMAKATLLDQDVTALVADLVKKDVIGLGEVASWPLFSSNRETLLKAVVRGAKEMTEA